MLGFTEWLMLAGVCAMGAMAPGVSTYVFAVMYHRAENLAASGVLIGTAASVLSVSAWLAILGT